MYHSSFYWMNYNLNELIMIFQKKRRQNNQDFNF